MFKRLSIAAAALAIAATAACTANVAPAAAHNTAGVPYHTAPTAASSMRYADGACEFSFFSPIVHGLFYDQYVYWRPIGAFWANDQWNYRYGETKRAIANPDEMVFGWASYQALYNDWFFSNGATGVGYFPRDTRPYLGYQIWGYKFFHAEWTSRDDC